MQGPKIVKQDENTMYKSIAQKYWERLSAYNLSKQELKDLFLDSIREDYDLANDPWLYHFMVQMFESFWNKKEEQAVFNLTAEDRTTKTYTNAGYDLNINMAAESLPRNK